MARHRNLAVADPEHTSNLDDESCNGAAAVEHNIVNRPEAVVVRTKDSLTDQIRDAHGIQTLPGHELRACLTGIDRSKG
nr:hypothetical protein [Microvirga aerilata]